MKMMRSTSRMSIIGTTFGSFLKPNLERRLREIYDPRPVKLMFIKTARNRKYEDVIEAMDIARGAGVQVIGFTPPESESK